MGGVPYKTLWEAIFPLAQVKNKKTLYLDDFILAIQKITFSKFLCRLPSLKGLPQPDS